MKYLLDTNAVSEFGKTRSADPVFRQWAMAQDDDDYAISVLTLMELETGILRLERRDPVQGAFLRRWLTNSAILTRRDRILPVSEAIALRCAHFHVPDPKSPVDALIAATALVHGLVLVTRNVTHIKGIDVPYISPWRTPAPKAP